MAILFLAAAVACIGCSTAKPLKFHYYSRNLVLGKDAVLRVENEPVDFTNLRQELVKRMITEVTPVVLHVHRQAPRPAFDTVVKGLKAEGFRNLSFAVFSD